MYKSTRHARLFRPYLGYKRVIAQSPVSAGDAIQVKCGGILWRASRQTPRTQTLQARHASTGLAELSVREATCVVEWSNAQ